MAEISVHLEADINPTESEEKVRTAASNILANASFTTKPSGKACLLTAETKGQDSLVRLRKILRNDRIRDAARKMLFRSIRENTLCFCLNKQVAFSGHVSFCEENAESPLGPIRINITADNPRQLAEWLAEKT